MESLPLYHHLGSPLLHYITLSDRETEGWQPSCRTGYPVHALIIDGGCIAGDGSCIFLSRIYSIFGELQFLHTIYWPRHVHLEVSWGAVQRGICEALAGLPVTRMWSDSFLITGSTQCLYLCYKRRIIECCSKTKMALFCLVFAWWNCGSYVNRVHAAHGLVIFTAQVYDRLRDDFHHSHSYQPLDSKFFHLTS